MNLAIDRRGLSSPALVFAVLTAILAICAALVHSSFFLREPDIAAWAVTFDLCLTVPLVFYVLVIRRGHARRSSIIPVFLGMIFMAGFIVPRANQQFLHALVLFSSPLELLLIAFLVTRVLKVRRTVHAERLDDPLDVIRIAARELFGDNRGTEAIVFELATTYYAVAGWRRKPPRGEGIHNIAETGEWATIVAALILMIAAEMVGLHLLIRLWSAKIAWAITTLDLYSIIWLIGDYQALRLRPVTIGTTEMTVRFGLRWTAQIPLAWIERVETVRGEEAKARDHIKLSLGDGPRLHLELREPVPFRGMFGLSRMVRTMSLGVQDGDQLASSLRGSDNGLPGSCKTASARDRTPTVQQSIAKESAMDDPRL